MKQCRLFAIALVGLLALAAVACGSSDKPLSATLSTGVTAYLYPDGHWEVFGPSGEPYPAPPPVEGEPHTLLAIDEVFWIETDEWEGTVDYREYMPAAEALLPATVKPRGMFA